MPAASSPATKAFRLALIYAVAAALWILLTDFLAASLNLPPKIFLYVSLYKGWAFVAVTAVLLYWLLRRDYAGLQRAVETAQEQERLLQSVLETLPVGVWLLDARGMIVHGNTEGERIWGGKRFVGPDDFGVYRGWWTASGQPITAEEWGAARAIREGTSCFNEEIRILGFDGVEREILHSVVPRRDEHGRLRGAIVVNQDVTDLKRAQSCLQRTEEFLANLLDNAPTPIYVTSAKGHIRLVNKAWCKLLDLSAEQVVGRRVDEIYPSIIANHYLENNRQVLEEEQTMAMEEYADLTDGRHYYQSVKFPVLDPVEGGLAAAGISIDITGRKQLEEQLQSYHRQLIAMASELSRTEVRERRRVATALHDQIGQPLALARIRLGELASRQNTEDYWQVAGRIRTLVEEAIRQVRDLVFEISPPILYELGLEAALKSLAERFSSQHGLVIDFAADDQAKPLPEDVRLLLFQAVRELLVNILKHARASRAQIRFGREAEMVRIVIEDDGVGFEPGQGEKNGFGLFNIRERLRHIGGGLEIVSKPERGSRIILSVPIPAAGAKGE